MVQASMEQPNRRARKVTVADHIWDAFEEMAREMGSDRDGLVNQAMFMFARLNGFLDGSGRTGRHEIVAAPRPVRASVQVLQAVERPVEPPLERALPPVDEEPPPPEPERPQVIDRESEELLGDDHADEPAFEARDERAEEPEVSANPVEASGSGLYLITETGEERVAKERYVIGRGKHCDLVINSGKVSREHASIVQDGDDWYIEDLGSSNGTWFNKQRIKRRKIEEGDEYFVCSERIRFALR